MKRIRRILLPLLLGSAWLHAETDTLAQLVEQKDQKIRELEAELSLYRTPETPVEKPVEVSPQFLYLNVEFYYGAGSRYDMVLLNSVEKNHESTSLTQSQMTVKMGLGTLKGPRLEVGISPYKKTTLGNEDVHVPVKEGTSLNLMTIFPADSLIYRGSDLTLLPYFKVGGAIGSYLFENQSDADRFGQDYVGSFELQLGFGTFVQFNNGWEAHMSLDFVGTAYENLDFIAYDADSGTNRTHTYTFANSSHGITLGLIRHF